MVGFPAVVALSSLNGTNGFRIDGSALYDRSGWSVATAGDVNGDGFSDLIIGASAADTSGSGSGASYVVFGSAGSFPANLDLSSLNGSNGFRLDGARAYDRSGWSVASAGDLNGDGFDDVIIGTYGPDPNEFDEGSAYVVFGGADGFAPSLDLSSLDGSNGFRLEGIQAHVLRGRPVSSAGDVNGDGFDDLIVGATAVGGYTGAAYVMFGKAGGFAANLDVSSLDGSNGFRLFGSDFADETGLSVSSAGDVNGDGFDDLIIGAPFAGPNRTWSGATYVVFGKAGGFSANVELSSLNGSNGFRLSGDSYNDRSGWSVSSAGDVNGDGFDDLLIGSNSSSPDGTGPGAAYVVFGKAGGFAANLDLSSLNGSNGFRIDGVAIGDLTGWSVSSAGDVNGDGFGDLLIGAHGADPNGADSGAAYVVFGDSRGFASSIDLSSLDGTNGFRIDGVASGDVAGRSVSVAGDLNGDGFDDLIVGAQGADPHGESSGSSYVIFGHVSEREVTRTGTEGDDTLSGGSFDDTLIGLGGNDTLDGRGGADRMFGGQGNDAFYVDQAGDRVFEVAGEGTDTVYALGSYMLRSGQSIETLRLANAASTAALNLTGNEIGQRLLGNAGDNRLDGGGGADRLYGFRGNDTFLVDTAGDRVFEVANEGNDRVEASVSYALAAGQSIETLALADAASTAALDLFGNELGQRLIGNAGANILDGGEGADLHYGLGGNDIYRVDNAGDQVYEAANAGNDRVEASLSFTLLFGQSIETLSFANVDLTADIDLTGNELGQRLLGNAGANTLDGGGGADTLYGFGGNDTFIVDTIDDRVFESVGEGTDRILSQVSYALAAGQSIETLALGNAASTKPLTLIGNELGQRLLGNAGSNTLDGGGSGDRLYGFGGDDTYRVDTTEDRVFELANQGNDRVEASVSYALAAGQSIETLALTDADALADLNLVGNELGQRLVGNAGANILDGRGGADRLYGLDGNDTYRVDNAGDLVFEAAAAGNDRVEASVSYALASGQSVETLALADAAGTAALNLIGNDLGQRVLGNAGANLIDGGGGSDILYGFGGADTFRFSTALGSGNIDRIMDFAAPRDTIQLDRSIFSTLALGTLSASAFKDIGDPGAVVDADDRILYDHDTGALFYDANGSAGGGRTQFAALDNRPANLTAGDFFVVA